MAIKCNLQNGDQIDEAYKVWKSEAKDVYTDIDKNLLKLSKEKSTIGDLLTQTVSKDKIDYLSKFDLDEKSFFLQEGIWKDREKHHCTVFNKTITFSESDIADIHKKLSEIYNAEMKEFMLTSGVKLHVSGYLASLLRSLYFAVSSIYFFKKLVVKVAVLIMQLVEKFFPFPDYKKSSDIQDGDTGMFYVDSEFSNWGGTVKRRPASTFFPKTVQGICNLVKYAKQNNKKIRLSGFRHSWPDLYADNDEIQVAMLPLEVSDSLRNAIELCKKRGKKYSELRVENIVSLCTKWNTEFQQIEIIKEYEEDGKKYANVRVGASVFGLQLLTWCFYRLEHIGITSYSLPLDVIMSLNTYGGVCSTMSHGAGWEHKTLSDLIVKIEYVDANGKHQSLDDAKLLKAAAGSLGMLGVLTHITFKMNEASFAEFQPAAVALDKAIPNPSGLDPSSEIYKQMVSGCENNYYSEWFWFHGNQKAWKNGWQDNGIAHDWTGPLIKEEDQEFQVATTYLMQGILEFVDRFLPDPHNITSKLVGSFVANMAMTVLPKPEHPITAVAFEAMHFQRGIHYLPVRCMEFLIPIQENPKKCGESDWSILPKAWWEVISYVNDNYGKLKACPMDLTLEMRVISESEMLLAPEHGNHYGTCSIEVLGTKLPSVESWEEFKNVIAEKWASYTDNQGKPLNVRPHWGKEFPKKIGNKDSIDFIRDAYRQSFKIFKLRMKEVSEKQGFSIEDMRKLFSNRYLDDLFGPLWEEE